MDSAYFKLTTKIIIIKYVYYLLSSFLLLDMTCVSCAQDVEQFASRVSSRIHLVIFLEHRATQSICTRRWQSLDSHDSKSGQIISYKFTLKPGKFKWKPLLQMRHRWLLQAQKKTYKGWLLSPLEIKFINEKRYSLVTIPCQFIKQDKNICPGIKTIC